MSGTPVPKLGRAAVGRPPADLAPLLRSLPGAPTPLRRALGLCVMLLVAGVFVASAWDIGFKPWRSVTEWPEIQDLLLRMMPTVRISEEPRLYAFSWTALEQQLSFIPETWTPLAETLRIAILGVGIGALAAIPLSLLSARNLVKVRPLYWGVRSALNLLRTVPDLVWAAVFVGVFGVGAVPGILAVTLFSTTIIAKMMSESVEAVDPGPLEATTAVGGNRLQTIWFAVVPQVLPQFVAYSLYVFEVNVRVSVILGLVGAGGIGQTLKVFLNFGKYQEVTVVVLVILVVVVVTDFISNKLRERLV